VDFVFGHLWLGHGSALREPDGMLNAFCQFCYDLQPKKVIVTHLEEFGRNANDFFDEGHAQEVIRIFAEKFSDIECSSLHMGEKVLL